MFAGLLQLELRRTAQGEFHVLHAAAAGWYAGHGFPVEAVRHAQAAQDWGLAARLLADHGLGLVLNGQGGITYELLAAFPAGAVAADAELTALMAAGELTGGSLEEAERYLAQAARRLEGSKGPVPAERRGGLQILLTTLGLFLARRRGDLPTVAEQADQLLAAVEDPDAAQLGLGEDLRALALVSLGTAEAYAARLEDADRHLEQGVALARRIGRPYLEFLGLAYGTLAAAFRSYVLGERRCRQAIELARRHGWGEDQAASVAYATLAGVVVCQGRLADAEPWLERAEQTLRAEAEPGAGMNLHYARGLLELARDRNEEAVSAFQAAERLAGTLVTPHTMAPRMRSHLLFALLRLGQTGRVEATLTGLDSRERASAPMCIALAALRLAQHDPQPATAALAPVIDGSAAAHPTWVAAALLLEAISRDALGDPDAAGHALERALDLAEPDRMFLPFLLHPTPELLERHAQQHTAHAALIAEILSVLTEASRPAAPPGEPRSLREPLSQAETRVLRYLPTRLSVPEIAGQLHLSVNTVRTHMRHVYDKLDAHRRHEAVEQARTLGLLAPSTQRPTPLPAGPCCSLLRFQ